MNLDSSQYLEKVYAGVLGKMIGVYLGRPVEGWSFDRIQAQIGDIHYYVHDTVGLPLLVTDDDLTGTFTFFRALEDADYDPALTSEFIGKTWLNYLIQERTILWWGGMGNSTEHTAYLRLKQGIAAPQSGCALLNGKEVSEQIGAQIFIDGWAMVSPGDPVQAADLAKRAAEVSHDGEAVLASQFLAALESIAFVERNIISMWDKALFVLPKDSVIYALAQDIRLWHTQEPDWRRARELLEAKYGYHIYGGNCHVVPNHGLILLALLYGQGDFHRSMMIINTAGWDTDCNSGNLGCLLGILGGLDAFKGGPDWLTPLHDCLYLPTADGGRAVSDALTEAFHIIKAAHRLNKQTYVAPKKGARFHFSLPGSVQGFQALGPDDKCHLENTLSESGSRVLTLSHPDLKISERIQASTPTFIPPEAKVMPGSYEFLASPSLYCGQTIQASLIASASNTTPVECNLFVDYYGESDQLKRCEGPVQTLAPGQTSLFVWTIPELCSDASPPIVGVGWACKPAPSREGGDESALVSTTKDCSVYPKDLKDWQGGKDRAAAVYIDIHEDREIPQPTQPVSSKAMGISVSLDWMNWEGTPKLILKRFPGDGVMASRMWVNALDIYEPNHIDEPYLRLIHNQGRGFLLLGCREWSSYRFQATLKPHMADGAGVAVCVQGMERYYALLLTQGKICLIKRYYEDIVLAEAAWDKPFHSNITLCLQTEGNQLKAWANSVLLFDITDNNHPLLTGGVALICETGRVACLQASVDGIEPSK